MLKEKLKWRPHKSESTDAGHRDGATCSSEEIFVMKVERRSCIVQLNWLVNQTWEEPMKETRPKSFEISTQAVRYAYRRIKENKGGAGVDGETIEEFEKNLENNLYKIWNRMSSGSYFPPPVLQVEIPKEGGVRKLGVPAVSDRIAQMVAKVYLEPKLEPHFHTDSYGYRPGKSAIQALKTARERCWRNDWVVDLDIERFFDTLDRDLLMLALKRHTDCNWILLYVKRWLEAPIQRPEGKIIQRERGTAQGSVISPLLSNLYLHYAFDDWMKRNHSNIPFERYADDAIAHCKSEKQAKMLLDAIEKRMAECGLKLNQKKTRIVYCKDDDRRGNYPNDSFDFLGYTFRPRLSKNKWGKHFINFTPGVSNKAKKRMSDKIREWRIQLRSDKTLEDLSRMFNPVIRGWINYFKHFYKSAMYPTLRNLNCILARWAMRKFKKLRRHRRRSMHWLGEVAKRDPRLFAHWQLGVLPDMAGQ